ncbi:ribonuclease E activity regulator RraA [Oceaniglobus roseus]|uniref:ribonuclease E activity regulator RraA n=1 Tax=Oceaniglobus roseus TaxID=1737570 RepID=UPI001C129E0F|nr:ribonuclease E activity regulator RraA [Kandeliimicrobium roseum]
MNSTCDLFDAHSDVARVLSARLVHFGGRTAFRGPAETVACFEDIAAIRALAGSPGQGRVMVVDAGGSMRCAVTGDRIAGLAQDNGWSGMIVWGCIRDRAALAALDFGVMALGSIPSRPRRETGGHTGVSVEIDGVPVAPGDMVFADIDGVLVLPAGVTGEVTGG